MKIAMEQLQARVQAQVRVYSSPEGVPDEANFPVLPSLAANVRRYLGLPFTPKMR